MAIILPSLLQAEEGILVVHVEDTKGNPVSGVELAPKGDGAPGAPTDRLGKTRLRLAPATKPGHWVTLQIVPKKGGPDWVFVSPWNQRTLVPSFANESENFVEVVLGERGNRDLLASDQAIRAIAALFLEQLGPKLGKNEITEEERKRVLAEQAAAFGLKPEEVDKAIRTWGAKAQDPYDAGLAALYDRNYPQAQENLKKSLEIRRQARDEAQAKVAEATLFLGISLYDQGKYLEAIVACQESIEAGGEDVANLSFLGIALMASGDLQGAAFRLERALELSEERFGPEHLSVTESLNNLAILYDQMHRYSEAESLFQRSLKIREEASGADDLDVATSLNNLATVYLDKGLYSEAERLLRRSLRIVEEAAKGTEDLMIAAPLNNLASLYISQGRYNEAEHLYQRSLKILEKSAGAEHHVAETLNELADLYERQGRYSEAESLCQRSLRILEKISGTEHPDVAKSLNFLAVLYGSQGRHSDAEPLLQRSLRI